MRSLRYDSSVFPLSLMATFVALVLALAAGAVCVVALGLRRQLRLAGEERKRLAWELAERSRELELLRQETESYRRLFERPGHPQEVPLHVGAALVAAPAPAPPTQPQARESIRDPLTGLFHQRYFEASLEREIHRMERRNLALGIVLLEVDDLEGFGGPQSAAAEPLLRAIGALLGQRVREGDVASRYGPATFGLILPDAPIDGVRMRAERLRDEIRELRIDGRSLPDDITFSIGVAAFPDNAHTSEKLLRAAKAALVHSREDGRDRVTVAPGAVLDRRLMLPE
ncbi:MAG TPA: GGDEF domain-containing protein [Thermoanaerobaculia bacterium]|nr:GGDEF domain-containing protein [Thermoanaerobaculia bacterium]